MADTDETPPPTGPHPAEVYKRTVRLGGGFGTVTLSTDVRPEAMSDKAQEFFYQLVDLMRSYDPEASDS